MTVAFRLTIYQANGTTPDLTLTSLRTGTNPYITGVPSGDGQEVDLLTGAVRSGAYVVEVADVATGTDSTGTIRIITNKLEDASFRQQLLSRRAKLECSRDNGTTWEVWTFGYLTSLRQTDAITYAFTVSDSRRLESTHTAFTWWSDTNKTTDERREFPNRGCILGGPMIQNFGPLRASGGWEFFWREVQSGYLALAFRAAYEPPSYTRSPYFTVSRWMYDSRNFLQKLPPVTGVTGTNYEQLRDREYVFAYPSLMAMVTVGNDTWYGSVRAAFTPVNYSGSGAGDRTQGFDISRSNYVYIELDPGQSTSYPSANAIARVRILQREVSEVSPIYIDDHPVNIVAKLYSTVGIPYSSTSVTNTKAAVGDDVRLALRVTQPVNMGQFLSDSIFGPFGFSARTNASGEQEFFPTRIANATAPTTSIASADIVGDTPPPVFEVDEATVVTSFKLTSKALVPFVPDPDNSQPPPADGMVQVEASQAVQNADTSTFSTREIAYTFPGMVHDGSASSAAFVLSPEVVTRFFNSIVAEGFDRFGRGAIATEVQVLPTSTAATLQVGDEVVLNIPYYPNKNYRIGESNVGTRIAQIVRRTEAPEGPIFKLIDSGLNQQPSSPTFTVATWSGDPRRVAAVTVTNASTLNSADTTLAVQYQVSSTTPTKTGTLFTRFRPGTIPTGAFLLPIAPPGSRVWVRMRTERAEYRASAWTAWTDVQLDAWVAPTSLATSAATANSITLTWSLAGNTLDPMDVFAYPGSTAPADWTPYRIGTLSAGSTTSIVRDLVASTQYTFGVAFRDSTTGAYSAFTTATASTAAVNTSSCPAAPKMKVITAFENAGSTTGVVLTIGAIEGYNVVVQRAPNVSGSPGTWSDIAVLLPLTGYFADILPSDGVTRWYRVFYRLSGFLDGTPGPARSATPIAIPDDLVLNEGPSLISGGSSLTFGSYLTGTPDNFYDGSTAQTLAVDATPNNTNNKVVARDNTGSFSANVVTATLDGAAPAGQLTGNTLAANVTASSLTSVGTIGTGVWQGTSVGKNYGGTGLTSSAFTGITNERVFAYDGVSGSFFVAPSGSNGQALVYSGGALAWGNPAPGSHVLADTTGLGSQHTTSGLTAGMILQATGATTARFQTPSIPASSVTAGTFSGSSYTITNDLTVSGTLTGTLTGNITGNAATVTNGVYTTGTYADPSWITSLAGSKISGNISGSAANVTGTVAIANGGTNATSYGTSGSGTRAIVYDIGSNAFEAVAAGTSGQFLQSAGNAGDITWATPPNFNSTTAGYAPASGGGTSNFLRADGTWAVPSVGSVSANNVTAGTFSGANYYFTNNVRFDSGARVAFGYGYTIDNAGGSPVSVLTATTLGSGVVNSSLTSVGTLTSGALGAGFTAIDNARLANSSIIINGTSVSLGGSITVDTSKWTASGSNIYYSTGNVSIGTTPSSSIELLVRGGGATSATYSLFTENSAATSTFSVADNGNVTIPNGNLGIGTSPTSNRLTVGGTATISNILYSTYNTASGIANNSFDVAKSVLGNIHIQNGAGTSGNNLQAAITFQGGSAGEAQAGIYVSNNNSTGTAMGFATTDSYAVGPKLFMTATNGGAVDFPRARPTYAGNVIIDTANIGSYAPTLTGTGASGTWGISITGNAGTATNVSGIVAIANGGTGASTAPNARTNLGATTVGSNFFTLPDPGAIGFIRINADNTVSALNGAGFRDAINVPTRTGGDASGTWAINITGNAATATSASNSTSTSQRAFSGDISTTGQGRFTGWYTGNAATGFAVEAGVSGDGYLIAYNRNTSEYGNLNINGTNIRLVPQGGSLTGPGGNVILHAGNYNSYAPTLTGGGASGTWGINITGTAGSAPANGGTATEVNGSRFSTTAGSYNNAYTWLQFHGGVGSYGLYWPFSGAGTHLYPFAGSYGSFMVEGSRNGYWGFMYNTGYGNSGWMTNGNTAGYYNHSYGWKYYHESGNFYIYTGTYGGGTGHIALHAGNYNSYSPTLTGGNASGTWNINVTGSSASTPLLSAVGTYTFYASTNGRDFATGIQTGFVDNGTNGYPNYGSIVRIKTYPNDGGTAELYFPYSGIYGGSAMRYRLGLYNNAGWTGWKTVLDDGNYSSYALPLSGGRLTGGVEAWSYFDGPSSNTSGVSGNYYRWGYQEAGAWTHPYPDLVLGYHTGMKFGANTGYGGMRFYADHPFLSPAELFSIGNGDSNVRVAASLIASSAVYSSNWFRSYGATGWYNESYGGGIWMNDSSWVRVYGTKDFYATASIAAVGNVTAYYSDERLKTKTGVIDSALAKVRTLAGFLYVENDTARKVGYKNTHQQVGVSAQAVQRVLPEAVSLAPFDMHTDPDTGEITSKSGENYLTVDYSRLVPLLIEAIKELADAVEGSR